MLKINAILIVVVIVLGYIFLRQSSYELFQNENQQPNKIKENQNKIKENQNKKEKKQKTEERFKENLENPEFEGLEKTELNNELESPEFVIDMIGNNKLIIYWQNLNYNDFKIYDSDVKVFQCDDNCNPNTNLEISNIEKSQSNCISCYAVINNLDTSKNIYLIQLTSIYKNNDTGKFFKAPMFSKTTKIEVEDNLNQVYKLALEQIIKDNIKRKDMEDRQAGQKERIQKLKQNLNDIKFEIAKRNIEGYNLEKIPNPDLKIIYDKEDMLANNTPKRQVIKMDGKFYKIGY